MFGMHVYIDKCPTRMFVFCNVVVVSCVCVSACVCGPSKRESVLIV